MKTALLMSGWGYWDTTHYPYGGCFRRSSVDELVEVVGPGGMYPPRESSVKFADGRTAVVPNFALQAQEVAC